MKVFGEICFILLVVFIMALVGGFTFSKLWNWFIVDAFNVQSLTVIQSIGVLFFLSFITTKTKSHKEFNSIEFAGESIYKMIHVLLYLGIGYIITLFQ